MRSSSARSDTIVLTLSFSHVRSTNNGVLCDGIVIETEC